MTIAFTNTTPWDTDALVRLITPLAEGLGVETIRIKTLTAMPGVRTEEQTQAEVSTERYGEDITSLLVELLSPKRAGKRTDTLDRLSLVEDLKPNETALPEKAVALIEHAFSALVTHTKRKGHKSFYEVRPCMQGSCQCKYTAKSTVLVKGDTKAPIKPPVTVEQLEQKLEWAQRTVDQRQTDLTEAIARRDRLQERITRLKAKVG
jgi:hypothetical protein